MEELDLDSFIESHGAIDFEDDDDGGDARPVSVDSRTVDEILLLNDSSSSVGSPSPPSSPSASSARQRSSSSPYSFPQPKQLHNHNHYANNNSHASANNTTQVQTLSHSLSLDSKIHNSSITTSASKTNHLPDFSYSRALMSTALLPPLFSAVRSNAKPGDALAAAAAASRSIPTPHAAAIKYSRTSPAAAASLSRNSSASAVVDDCNLASDTPPPGVSDDVDRGVDKDVGRSGNCVHQESLGDSVQTFCSEVTPYTDAMASLSSTNHSDIHFNSPAQIEKDLDFPANSDIAVKSEGKHLPSSSFDEGIYHDVDSKLTHVDAAYEKEIIIPADLNDGKIIFEDEFVLMEGFTDDDNAIFHSTDDLYDYSSMEEDSQIAQDVVALSQESKKDTGDTWGKSQPPLKPLELAEESEKKQAFTAIHLEEGAAAQPMRLEGVRRGSSLLGYFDVNANNAIARTISSQAFRREHGFPQALAVNVNYIAVGMSKGVIMVTPSKYHPYLPDNMDTKMSVLGLQGDRPYASVTSMCFNQQGDLLFAGYANGHVSVWDVQKASVLKVMNDLHKAPVVHMLYMGQDSSVNRQFIISGDSKGGVKLTRFSVMPWLNRFSFSSTELLNSKTGPVICASPLLFGDCQGSILISSQSSTTVSTSAIGSMMGGVIGGEGGWKNSSLVHESVVVLVTYQAALVAKVIPTVEPYAQIPKPEGVAEGSIPYTAWKFISESQLSSNESSGKFALLAIAWDRRVQVAKLVKSELKVYGKWTLDSPAVGVAWLDDQMLVVLTSVGQLCLFAKDGIMIHQTSFAVEGSRSDDLISYHTYFNNSYGNPEKAHHNCLAVRGASIYILGPSDLVIARLLPWKERVEVLRRAGDWMGALNMAMTFYDGQAHGVIDLPRTLDDVHETIMPYLAELLLSYVDEVFSYIQVASGNQVGNADQSDESKSSSFSDHPDIKEQYIRVGGVAVEFCVHIKRTDILFEEIFSKFCTDNHRETFLELLEPYILKDMLGSLPPAIMQALVEHYSIRGWLQRVEQCVLHMDISSLDFNQVVRLCREHRLHGALIYLFNKGLDDFRTPLEELLLVLRSCQRETVPMLGYRVLVYLKYCFQGLAFPPGHGSISPTRVPSVRKELVQFLLEDSIDSKSRMTAQVPSNSPYPNLRHLLELDTDATLDVLGCAFEDNEISKSSYLSEDLTNSDVELVGVKDLVGKNETLIQEVVDILSVILDISYFKRGYSSCFNNDCLDKAWPSTKDAGCIFEFIAYYVACQRAKVSREVLSQILEYLTSEISISPGQTFETSKRREKQLLALLEVVPEIDWDAPRLLHLCEESHFHQACGFIHAIRHQYLASLDSYMKVVDEPVHAFSFIHDILLRLHDKESDVFRVEVISRIPDLVMISREGTFFLVVEHFYEQSQLILFSELQSHPKSLFLYLKTLIEVHSTGNLDFSCLRKGGGTKARHELGRVNAFLEALLEFPKILRNNPIHVTDEMAELYLELLCRYERESVLKFLETFESYRVENCLRLCQENGIVDAAAFLLERVGDVGSALSLVLSRLNDKFLVLDSAIASELSDSGIQHLNKVLKKKEVKDILDIVNSSIGLCQRNSPRLDSREAEHLWFQLLDLFCEPLMDEFSNKGRSAVETSMDDLVSKQEDEGVSNVKWKISKSHKGARILRRLLSIFIKKIVEGMIGYVRLPKIMLKLLSDNGTQEFGDFKLTILGMLGTYDFERRILDSAKSLIEDDSYYTMSLLKKGASHGYAPRSLLCCVCNCPVVKSNQSPSVRVFVCGHAMHVHCELQESESSVGGLSSGCPICVPRKKSQRSKGKFMLVENGLVSKVSSNKAAGMVPLHSPSEGDVFENIYGSNPIPRFELLSNLQKDQRSVQIENVPQLRLAPPAVYHEKVMKRTNVVTRESSSRSSKAEKSRSRQIRDVKIKVSSIRSPLRSNIFGKDMKDNL